VSGTGPRSRVHSTQKCVLLRRGSGTFRHDPESTRERVSNFDNLPHPLRTSSRMETLNQISDGDPVKIIPDGSPGLGKSPQTPAYQST